MGRVSARGRSPAACPLLGSGIGLVEHVPAALVEPHGEGVFLLIDGDHRAAKAVLHAQRPGILAEHYPVIFLDVVPSLTKSRANKANHGECSRAHDYGRLVARWSRPEFLPCWPLSRRRPDGLALAPRLGRNHTRPAARRRHGWRGARCRTVASFEGKEPSRGLAENPLGIPPSKHVCLRSGKSADKMARLTAKTWNHNLHHLDQISVVTPSTH